jgi:5-methylcytosine-specific restriction endonuclease McrA
MQLKECNKCNHRKPATTEYFGKHKNNKDGLTYACRACKAVRDRDYNQTPESRYRYRKYDAARKGRTFSITQEEFVKIVTDPRGCAYCGTTKVDRSLDRVNNAQGYERDNVVACCSPCNASKGDKSLREWRGE